MSQQRKTSRTLCEPRPENINRNVESRVVISITDISNIIQKLVSITKRWIAVVITDCLAADRAQRQNSGVEWLINIRMSQHFLARQHLPPPIVEDVKHVLFSHSVIIHMTQYLFQGCLPALHDAFIQMGQERPHPDPAGSKGE